MIIIDIPEVEYFDPISETFMTRPSRVLKLEHSLVAISKWESKWLKPFMGPANKTPEEIYDYIRCMYVGDEECDIVTIKSLSQENLNSITKYIESPMTATTVTQKKGKANREIITSELIYYWMVTFNIPFECQNWHLNRLLMLITICNIKNEPPKKQNPKDVLRQNAALNAARKKSMNTSG